MTEVDSFRAGSAAPDDRASVKNWLGVLAVALGTFLVVTVENLPMGLLTGIGGTLHVSVGAVGLMVTVSGLVAALTAPVLPVLIKRLDRRVVLLALILFALVGNLVTALTPNYAVLLVTRLLIGISIGGFWALAAGLGVRLVPQAQIAKATSLIFFGAMVANVLGVPAGTLIGNLTNWRVAFGVLAALSGVLLVALFVLLPKMPATTPVSLRSLAGLLRLPAVRTGVLATFLLVAGHYGAFTFVSPILQDVSGISATAVGPLLLAYGLAGIAGNFLAGSAAGRDVRRTIILVSLALAVILAVYPLIGGNPVTGSVLLILWGLAFGGLPVCVQTFIMKAAPNETEGATGLNTCMFNLAIALGALFGSVVADSIAVIGVLWIAAALVVLTSLAVRRTRLD